MHSTVIVIGFIAVAYAPLAHTPAFRLVAESIGALPAEKAGVSMRRAPAPFDATQPKNAPFRSVFWLWLLTYR